MIKIALSILLLLCLFRMPYGYFELVRYLSFAGFLLLAYLEKDKNGNAVIFYIFLALLFQPFFKISLGRPLWNIVDVLVAIGLFLSLSKK
uniref:DUF6804 family protein n=1 Tax=Ornithobacterium rhinotracheale TaxID=28251 RepID=UPI00288B1942|nr:DUF6804 family protein [Ornithobacterium rhinotracheale]